MEYLERDRMVFLSGDVRIRFEDSIINAREIQLDLDREYLTAEGPLVWESTGLKATGSRMEFDMKNKTGVVDDVSLSAGAWRCYGEKVSQLGEKEIEVSPGTLTTCDAKHPHYSIRCRRVRIRLDNDLLATQVTVLAGNTPVFWLPVLATPLKEFRLPFQAQVGRTSRLGMFVRTSPAYEFARDFPGQAHLDYFTNKGWGYGITQDVRDSKGDLALRLHAYQITERQLSPNAPRRRWELFAESSRALGPTTHMGLNVAYVSDAHFRELYGNADLSLPNTAGQRHAQASLSQQLSFGHATATVRRVETQRTASLTLTDTGSYALSEVQVPHVNFDFKPLALSPWLDANGRLNASRSFSWSNGWYVNEWGTKPGLEAHGVIPGLGMASVSPSLPVIWRDRGDRVPYFIGETFSGEFIEDANSGFLSKFESISSLQRRIPLASSLELSHSFVKRLDHIGYDPFNYNGVESHVAGARVSWRFGDWATASLAQTYDLRNKQDRVARRWGPLCPRFTLTPFPRFSVYGQGEYDLFLEAWRRIDGGMKIDGGPEGWIVNLRPTLINNQLAPTKAAATSRNYIVTREVYYGPALYTSPLFNRRLIYLDGTLGFPLTSLIRVEATGQLDLAPPDEIYLPLLLRRGDSRYIRFYRIQVMRDLHCWRLVGTFERFSSGETRFSASLNLRAFPLSRVPLLTL